MTSFGNIGDIRVHHVQVAPVQHDGIDAVLVTEPPGQSNDGEDKLAVLPGTKFHNGTIEVDIAGRPAAGRRKRPGVLLALRSGSPGITANSSVFTSALPTGAPTTNGAATTRRSIYPFQTIPGISRERRPRASTRLTPIWSRVNGPS